MGAPTALENANLLNEITALRKLLADAGRALEWCGEHKDFQRFGTAAIPFDRGPGRVVRQIEGVLGRVPHPDDDDVHKAGNWVIAAALRLVGKLPLSALSDEWQDLQRACERLERMSARITIEGVKQNRR